MSAMKGEGKDWEAILGGLDGATLPLLRARDPIAEERCPPLLGLLVPLVEATPQEPAAVDALGRVAERCEPGLVGALLDWWMIAGAGDRSRNSQAYTLPDTFGPELRTVLEVTRDMQSPIPPVRWLQEKPWLDEAVEQAERYIDYDSHGASKLPAERHAWDQTVRPILEEALAALLHDRRARMPDLDRRRMEDVLTSENVADGSARWRNFFSRVDAVEEAFESAIELQHRLAPWSVTTHEVDRASLELPERPEALKRTGELLLWRLNGRAAPVSDEVLGATLERLLGLASPSDALYLAGAAAGWARRSERAGERLRALLERRDDIAERAEALREAEVDVEMVLLHLDEDLDEAGRLLAQLEEEHQQRRLRQKAEGELARMREAARGDDQSSRDIEAVEADIAHGDYEKGLTRARELVRARTQRQRDQQLEEMARLADRLESVGAARPVVAEIRNRVGNLRAQAGATASAHELEALRDRVAQAEVEARRRTEQALQTARDQLAAHHDLLPEDARDEVNGLLGQAERRLEAGELAVAEQSCKDAVGLIERRQVPAWRADQGETELVEHLVAYLTHKHDFHEVDIRRLHVSLKSKRFVILAGLSGSGKSTIARLYAEALDATTANGRFHRIAVRPNWVDATEVLGYLNPVSNRFEPGWLADVIRSCQRDPDLPFFVVLDEMNLAPVEQYFADVLSAMEEARSGGDRVQIQLYPPGARPTNAEEWEPALPFPDNLFILGTVNVDETTRPMSDRLLDRANVLQLSVEIGRGHHGAVGTDGGRRSWRVRFGEWRQICEERPVDQYHDFLVSIAKLMTEMRIGMGVRSHIEIEVFLANAAGVIPSEQALDFALLQRVVPKIRGFKRDLETGLGRLSDRLAQVGCPRTRAVIASWLDPDVSEDAFLDGIDAAVGLIQV